MIFLFSFEIGSRGKVLILRTFQKVGFWWVGNFLYLLVPVIKNRSNLPITHLSSPYGLRLQKYLTAAYAADFTAPFIRHYKNNAKIK